MDGALTKRGRGKKPGPIDRLLTPKALLHWSKPVRRLCACASERPCCRFRTKRYLGPRSKAISGLCGALVARRLLGIDP